MSEKSNMRLTLLAAIAFGALLGFLIGELVGDAYAQMVSVTGSISDKIANMITAAGSLIGALAAVYAALKIKHVEHNTNSMREDLVKVTRKDALAEGKKIEKDKTEGK